MPVIQWIDQDSDRFWVFFLSCGHCVNTPYRYGGEEGDVWPCYKCEREKKEVKA